MRSIVLREFSHDFLFVAPTDPHLALVRQAFTRIVQRRLHRLHALVNDTADRHRSPCDIADEWKGKRGSDVQPAENRFRTGTPA